MAQQISAPPKANHIVALDSLRGLMSWWVVAGHVATALAFSNLHNDLAVDVFVILSGFVIFRLIEQQKEPYAQFITRRAFRLFPAYLVALAASILLLPTTEWVYASVFNAGQTNAIRVEIAQEGQRHLSWHLATHLPLLQGLVPQAFLKFAPVTLIGQAWSVSLEWQFYLAAPLAYMVVKRRKWWLAGIAAVGLLMVVSRYFDTAFLGTKLPLFGVGLGTFLWLHARTRGAATIPALSCWIAFSVLSILKGGLLVVVPLALWTITVLSISDTASAPLKAIARLLSVRVLKRLGDMSYSTYLVHTVAMTISAATLAHLGFSGLGLAVFYVVGTVALTLLMSELSFRYIEAPMNQLGRSIARRNRPANEIGTTTP